jgi:hypothetical protein
MPDHDDLLTADERRVLAETPCPAYWRGTLAQWIGLVIDQVRFLNE